MVHDELSAINALERQIAYLDRCAYDTRSIKHFFEVGEWLISFKGIENIQNANSISDNEFLKDFEETRHWMYT